MCLHVCMNIIHRWQCYKLGHTSWRYHLLWQVYVLFNFHHSRLGHSLRIQNLELIIQRFRSAVICWGKFFFCEFLLVFLCILLSDLPRLPPVCGVGHSPVLYFSLLWHIDWVPFKSPVLPPLFTPIVNLYNAVKDCFTHLDYTICLLLQQPDMRQAVRGEDWSRVEWSCRLATSSLPRGRCSVMAPERALALL